MAVATLDDFPAPVVVVAFVGLPVVEDVLLVQPGGCQRQLIAPLADFGRAVVLRDDIHDRPRPCPQDPARPALGGNHVVRINRSGILLILIAPDVDRAVDDAGISGEVGLARRRAALVDAGRALLESEIAVRGVHEERIRDRHARAPGNARNADEHAVGERRTVRALVQVHLAITAIDDGVRHLAAAQHGARVDGAVAEDAVREGFHVTILIPVLVDPHAEIAGRDQAVFDDGHLHQVEPLDSLRADQATVPDVPADNANQIVRRDTVHLNGEPLQRAAGDACGRPSFPLVRDIVPV